MISNSRRARVQVEAMVRAARAATTPATQANAMPTAGEIFEVAPLTGKQPAAGAAKHPAAPAAAAAKPAAPAPPVEDERPDLS